MSWICKQCEAENSDNVFECEVCDSKSPNLSLLCYDEFETLNCTKIKWIAKDFNQIKLFCYDQEYDVTDLSDFTIDTNTDSKIRFLLKSDIADREFLYSINKYKFEASKNVIKRNIETAKLSWCVNEARQVSVIDETGSILSEKHSGEFVVHPISTTYYTINVIFDDGLESSKRIDLKVSDESVINQFYPVKNICYDGDQVEMFWDVENANTVKINGELTTSKGNCLYTIDVKHQDFKLEVEDDFGINTKLCHIDIYDNPIVEFSINKNKLKRGQEDQVDVKWSIKNAKSSTLMYGSETKSISHQGKMSVNNIKESTSFKILSLGLDGEREFSSDLEVAVIDPAEINFTSDKLYVFPAIPFTLKWNVEHAKSVSLNGKYVSKSDSKCMHEGINETTTYTIIAKDDFGSTKKTLTISILPVPVMNININPPVFNSSIVLNHGISSISMGSCSTPILPNVQVKAPFVETVNLNMEMPRFENLKLPNLSFWKQFKCSINNAYIQLIKILKTNKLK